MTTLFFFESQADADEAAGRLSKLGKPALRLLAECVEKQELVRQKASASALALESEGFLIIREDQAWPLVQKVYLLPTLAGEEALETLESTDEQT